MYCRFTMKLVKMLGGCFSFISYDPGQAFLLSVLFSVFFLFSAADFVVVFFVLQGINFARWILLQRAMDDDDVHIWYIYILN